MSLLKTTALFTFCALLAAPVLAQPAASVDLEGGLATPTLVNGSFVWNIGVDPDEALAVTTIQGTGGSVAVDIGFTLTGLEAIAAAADGTNVENNNPGASTFGDEPTGEGVEIGTDASNVFAGVGSGFFSFDSGSPLGAQQMLSITTAELTTTNLTTTLAWGGGYDATGAIGAGDFGAIAQADGVTSTVTVPLQGSLSYTALAGDANLDGAVDFLDVAVVSGNFGTGTTWDTGDYNGDDTVDFLDVAVLSGNFGNTAISVAAVPEPSTIAMVLVAACGLIACRVRK